MNKKIGFFLSGFLLLISCSNDDCEKAMESESVLPKKLIVTEKGSSESLVTTFVYDGNKILSINKKNEKIIYSYNGDKIVKEIKFHLENNQEQKYSESTFIYNKNHLETVNTMSYGNEITCKYVYNSDGTITKLNYKPIGKSEKELREDVEEVLIFKDGNLIKGIESYKVEDFTYIRTIEYEYDNMCNAFKNVLGLNQILDQNRYSTNNLKKRTVCSSYGSKEAVCDYIDSYIYNYNSKGYPIREQFSGMEGIAAVIEYIY